MLQPARHAPGYLVALAACPAVKHGTSDPPGLTTAALRSGCGAGTARHKISLWLQPPMLHRAPSTVAGYRPPAGFAVKFQPRHAGRCFLACACVGGITLVGPTKDARTEGGARSFILRRHDLFFTWRPLSQPISWRQGLSSRRGSHSSVNRSTHGPAYGRFPARCSSCGSLPDSHSMALLRVRGWSLRITPQRPAGAPKLVAFSRSFAPAAGHLLFPRAAAGCPSAPVFRCRSAASDVGTSTDLFSPAVGRHGTIRPGGAPAALRPGRLYRA